MEAGRSKDAAYVGDERVAKVSAYQIRVLCFETNMLTIYYLCTTFREVEVKDFGASWRDGVAFLALIDSIKANLINLAEMKKASNKQRLETAFDVAETNLGIARLLDAEDVDVEKPDEKSIMTYVAQFLHKYPEPKVSN